MCAVSVSAADDAAGNGAASAARSAQHGVQGRHNNSAHWPFTFNSTVDGTIDAKYYAAYQAAWSPTSKVNTHENVYHHMLQLRTLQPRGAHGHIGFYPLQTFKYYWEARRITNALRVAKQARWPITCEVGFGTGMSTSVLVTATSSPESSLIGGTHHIFDCRYCQGIAGGKTPSWNYLTAVFGERLQMIEGVSDTRMLQFATESPATKCDLLSIDGAHTYPQVLRDVRAARRLAHADTILLFDDYQYDQVNKSIREAVAEGLIRVTQVFNAESDPDPIFASNRKGKAHAPLRFGEALRPSSVPAAFKPLSK